MRSIIIMRNNPSIYVYTIVSFILFTRVLYSAYYFSFHARNKVTTLSRNIVSTILFTGVILLLLFFIRA